MEESRWRSRKVDKDMSKINFLLWFYVVYIFMIKCFKKLKNQYSSTAN